MNQSVVEWELVSNRPEAYGFYLLTLKDLSTGERYLSSGYFEPTGNFWSVYSEEDHLLHIKYEIIAWAAIEPYREEEE